MSCANALAPAAADAKALYEALALRDVQLAADVLRPVWDESRGRDGHVSLEVSPRLAHDLEGTLAEARRLWTALDRPNAMIKVPATPAGILAVEQLIDDGLNVNVTLLFSLAAYERYRAVLKADAEVKDVPVILLTNLGQKDDVEKGLEAGAADYLIKAHFKPSEIVDKVKKILHV